MIYLLFEQTNLPFQIKEAVDSSLRPCCNYFEILNNFDIETCPSFLGPASVNLLSNWLVALSLCIIGSSITIVKNAYSMFRNIL